MVFGARANKLVKEEGTLTNLPGLPGLNYFRRKNEIRAGLYKKLDFNAETYSVVFLFFSKKSTIPNFQIYFEFIKKE